MSNADRLTLVTPLFLITAEDMEALANIMRRRSFFLRWLLRWLKSPMYPLTVVLFSALLVVDWNLGKTEDVRTGGVILALLILVYWLDRTAWRPALLSFLRRPTYISRKITSTPRQVEISPEGLRVTTPAGEGKSFRWLNARSFDHEADWLVIFFSRRRFLLIPRHAFAERSEFDAFCQSAAQFHQAAAASPR